MGPRAAGRPRIAINEDDILELPLRGYSRRGIAIHLGCQERTLERRLADLFCAPPTLASTSRQLLYRLAIEQHDVRALLYLAKRARLRLSDEDEEED